MREIVLDTETTGLDPNAGHRIVEIGCVELVNQVPTGNTYHQYVNPERDMPAEAFAVHGLSEEFLSGHPVFSDVVEAFLDFIGDARLVIHNAGFDMKFINAELVGCGRVALPMERALDTVQMARQRYPGAQASLDALCRRFGIDNSSRTLHGALLDADLLAEVYLQLMGGRQRALGLAADTSGPVGSGGTATNAPPVERPYRAPRPHAPSDGETQAHLAFLAKLSEPLWLAGQPQDEETDTAAATSR